MTTKPRRGSYRENPRPGRVRAGWPVRYTLLGAVGVVLALAITYGLLAAGPRSSGPQPPEALAEEAPDIVLATVDGEFQLSEHRGHVVLLYFSFPG